MPILKGSLSGFDGIPKNNNVFVSGINQDGADFTYNYYSPLQLFWNFTTTPLGYQTMNQVIAQQDGLLTVSIQTDVNQYTIEGTIEGSNEGGVIELVCPYPYFTLPQDVEGCKTILDITNGLPLIDFTLPRVFFTSEVENRTLEVDSLFFNTPVFTLSGSFVGCRVLHVQTGTEHILEGQTCLYRMIIDSVNVQTSIDGLDVSPFVRGQYPELVGGKNTFIFSFDTQASDIEVCYKYKAVTSNVL